MRESIPELLVTIDQRATKEIAHPDLSVFQQIRQLLARHSYPLCQRDAEFR